jgi:hypothetical protein
MDCFIINNITENDTRTNNLRILVENKSYFPMPDDEIQQTYDIMVKVGSEIYDRQYIYYRYKSGRLNIGAELFRDKLRINAGDILVVVVLEENSLYQVINLRTLI